MANPLRVNLAGNGLFIEHLCASYSGSDLALDDINLQFPAGSRTAVIGASGSGKSTLIRVLQGQLESTSGIIHDGRQPMGPATLKANSAVVEQQATLFGVTLRENLQLAAPAATDSQLLAAIKQVGMETWLAAQPQGLDQQLGEGGARLSGGQAQRLSLARALLADRPILLLDEPTSALDVHSEAGIIQTLRELDPSTTIITVTHRLGLLADYDHVVVMDHGRVLQAGPRQELLGQEGYLKDAMQNLNLRTARLRSSGLNPLEEGQA
nr:ATP-binding cassette domain-containing protein [Glutamicibacter sp. FBE19]